MQGNWVEDQFGERLAARDLGSQTVMTQTVSQVSYVDPATMVSKADVGAPKMETDDTLRTGLSYNNLFKHGPANSANPVAMTDAGLERMRARAANLASVKRTTQERKPEVGKHTSHPRPPQPRPPQPRHSPLATRHTLPSTRHPLHTTHYLPPTTHHPTPPPSPPPPPPPVVAVWQRAASGSIQGPGTQRAGRATKLLEAEHVHEGRDLMPAKGAVVAAEPRE